MMMCYPLSRAGSCLGIQGPFRQFFINEVSFKDSKIVGPKWPFLWHCQRITAGPRASKTPAIRDGKEACSCSARLAQQGKENRPRSSPLTATRPAYLQRIRLASAHHHLTSMAMPILAQTSSLSDLYRLDRVLGCNSSVPKPRQAYE